MRFYQFDPHQFSQKFHFKRKNNTSSAPPNYSSLMIKSIFSGLIVALFIFAISFLVFLTPINIQSPGFWMTLIIALAAFFLILIISISAKSFGYRHTMATKHISWSTLTKRLSKLIVIPALLFVLLIVINILGHPIFFNADNYASILPLEDSVFEEDLAESLTTDSIALMDSESARMLGDREIGSLSTVVSQFDVSSDYIQIDFNGKPLKVAAMNYADFFKWLGNRNEGVPGYVTVDPVSMSASYQECEKGMIYVPSAYLLENASRHLRIKFPTLMMNNLHLEIDESGKPYYIASVYEHSIKLFNGTIVTGAVILDPVTGDAQYYKLEDVPVWTDYIIDGSLICQQYNWYGTLNNGFFNSILAKKGCKQITTYRVDSYDPEDSIPVTDYGYVAKDGDIWIYTGVTSLNSDSSNIGFLLANQRTGEAHYYAVSGADEKSAMSAAEGEVQEKRYQASFPSLINVSGQPTYIMVLKDASGLVKLYATVNVEQYNIVTTATSQAECIAQYKKLLGISDLDLNQSDPSIAPETKTIKISDIKYIDINGNTYIYLISEQNELYRAMAASNEDLLLLKPNQTITLQTQGKEILSFTIK